MGILNVTPDSFSDGGRYLDVQDAVEHAREMVRAGASIIDVGGESTRPGSAPVSPDEEWERIRGVLSELVAKDICVSVDTRHAEVAQAACLAGASIINDVSGFTDPAMLDVVAGSDVGVVCMHMRGTPQTMQNDTEYADVVGEVLGFLATQAARLEAQGVDTRRICIDPGPGFGKSAEDTDRLMRNINLFCRLGYPVMCAISRKSYLRKKYGLVSESDTPFLENLCFFGKQSPRDNVCQYETKVPRGFRECASTRGNSRIPPCAWLRSTKIVREKFSHDFLELQNRAAEAPSRISSYSYGMGASEDFPDLDWGLVELDLTSAIEEVQACNFGASVVRAHNVSMVGEKLRELAPYALLGLGCNVPYVKNADVVAGSLPCAKSSAHEEDCDVLLHDALPENLQRLLSTGQTDIPQLDEETHDKVLTLIEAMRLIAGIPGVMPVDVSRFYESEPAYYEDQDAFINSVMLIRCSLAPDELLNRLHDVENALGRRREIKNGPRTCDIDILDMQGCVMDSSMLTLPHPRILERDFVVEPLLELRPKHVLANGVNVADSSLPRAKRLGHSVPI